MIWLYGIIVRSALYQILHVRSCQLLYNQDLCSEIYHQKVTVVHNNGHSCFIQLGFSYRLRS